MQPTDTATLLIKQRLELLVPEYRAFLNSDDFVAHLTEVTDIDSEHEDWGRQLRNELLMLLLFYRPLEHFVMTAHSTTGIPVPIIERTYNKFIAALPKSIIDELIEMSTLISKVDDTNTDGLKALHQQFQQSGGNGSPTATAYGYASVPRTQPAVAVAPEQAAPQAETAPAPEPTHNVTPMRTMPADMNRIHGYGAYRQINPQAGEDGVVRAAPQDELLKERPRLMGTPNLGG